MRIYCNKLILFLNPVVVIPLEFIFFLQTPSLATFLDAPLGLPAALLLYSNTMDPHVLSDYSFFFALVAFLHLLTLRRPCHTNHWECWTIILETSDPLQIHKNHQPGAADDVPICWNRLQFFFYSQQLSIAKKDPTHGATATHKNFSWQWPVPLHQAFIYALNVSTRTYHWHTHACSYLIQLVYSCKNRAPKRALEVADRPNQQRQSSR